MTTKVTPLPRKPFFVICSLLFSESFASTMLFPYVSFMVETFGIATDERELGYFAGYLASSYFFCQFISSFFLGYLSDRIGRKTVLMVGTCGTMLSCMLFGFSSNYAMAIVSRSLGGLLNSNWAIAKAYVGEITDSTNKPQGFSLIAMIAGVATIAGPILGGMSAQPAKNWPSMFSKDSFFGRNEFALPSFIATAFCVFALINTFLFMDEKRQYQKLQVNTESIELTDTNMLKKSNTVNPGKEEGEAHSDIDVNSQFILQKNSEQKSIWHRVRSAFSTKQKTYNKLDSSYEFAKEDEEEEQALPVDSQSVIMEPVDDIEVTLVEDKKLGFAVLKKREVMILLILFSGISLTYISADEIFPLWSLTAPEAGGIGFNSAEIGIATAIAGLSLIVFQMAFYARLANRFGSLWCFKLGSFLGIIVFSSYPAANMVSSSPVAVWVVVGVVMLGRAIVGTLSFTSINILLAEVAPKDIGTVNGVSMSFGGLMRALGPAFGGNLFAWSATNGLAFPLDFHFTFLLLGLTCLITLLLTRLVKVPKKTPLKDSSIVVAE